MAVDTVDVSHAAIEYIDPHLLHPHPHNVKIYGEEDISALKESIAESGWIKPLTVNPELTVISGHRRYRCALELGYTRVPIIIEAFPTPEAEMERLLRENENRGKTPEQQIREAMTWEPIEAAKAKIRQGERRDLTLVKVFTNVESGKVIDIVARRVGLGSGVTYEKGRTVVEAIDKELSMGDPLQRGELLRITLNEQSISAASNLLDKIQKADERARQEQERKEAERRRQQELARQRYLEAVKKAEHCTLYHCSVSELSRYVHPDCIDSIITDPPYPKEYLSVYRDLAEFAAYALKPGGSLVVMVGQSYLQEVMERLSSTGLTYRWTFAYLTPGVATQVHQGHAQSMWKPLLWYTKGDYAGMYIYDVFKDDVLKSDKGDKRSHDWGQSESGMAAIMERMSKTDELVCDPFVGGGTTAIVAMEMKRRFVGCDIDETCVLDLEERKKKSLEKAGYGLSDL